MKTAVATLCLVLFTATVAFGQTPDQRAAQMHRGRIKIWTGTGLVAAGLLVFPVTAVGHTTSAFDPSLAGVGLIAAGVPLIFWGVMDQQRARRPTLTFGVTIGQKSAIQIRRNW